ncbi:MAG: hypothetical protein GY730_09445 [bacterium]|nr:hypothetical protein [bacterium]
MENGQMDYLKKSIITAKFVLILFVYFIFLGIANAGEWEQIEQKLTASDGAAWDLFAWSVSISGDKAIVGAHMDDNPTNSGSAYIYEKINGTWVETKLIANDGAAGNVFGYSVSISDNKAIVGAHYENDNGTNSGAAYIYEKINGAWVETKLAANDGAAGDHFGYSVSISGDKAIVGAYKDYNDNKTFSGSAYIYEKIDGTWVETKLVANDGAAYDYFGHSVSISDDKAIVGAFGKDDNGTDSGAAYIYEKINGTWVATKLIANDGAAWDLFAWSVSISGDKAIVGAYMDDDPTNSGSAYIYEKINGTWVETKLIANDGVAGHIFGYSVSISGDKAIVGTRYDNDNGTHSGAAYIYEKINGTWVEIKLIANDGAAYDYLGYSVSISNDQAIVGAFGKDDSGTDSGAAYIFSSEIGITTP